MTRQTTLPTPLPVPGPLVAVHIDDGAHSLCGARPVTSGHVVHLSLWRRLVQSLQCRDCLEWLHA